MAVKDGGVGSHVTMLVFLPVPPSTTRRGVALLSPLAAPWGCPQQGVFGCHVFVIPTPGELNGGQI